MYTIIYRSVAQPYLDDLAVHSMLIKAQEKNEHLQVTGCLLYHNRIFIQLIEGDEDIIKDLFNDILTDDRHYQIDMLHSEFNQSRLFANWSMVFNNLDNPLGDVERKQELFKAIIHQSIVVQSPNMSKLTLWRHVFDLLRDEGILEKKDNHD